MLIRHRDGRTSILVSRTGMRMINTIHNMKAIGGKGILSESSLPPAGSWRKMASRSSSPVVIETILNSDLAGEENGDLCYMCNKKRIINDGV